VVFGQRVAALREATGLAPAEAAHRAGVSAAYWSVIERATPQGRNKVASLPRVPVVRALADAIDADKAELLDLAGYADHADLERARVARLRTAGDPAPGSDIDLEAIRLLAPDVHAALETLLGTVAALVTAQPIH